ncbi:MAG TPA: SDR family oxidoreductase [Pseudolabrys sp.]|nr:SDR family oxidoreductase [Pseudolabrys sp.]
MSAAQRLAGKSVLVTGAGGAVGKAVCSAIESNGGHAVRTDLGGDGMDHALDVTSEADWRRVIAALDKLDGLVNAAGIVALGSVEELDFATWRRVLAVNLDGTFLGCKHAFALLKRQGGAIVNLSSVSGQVGGHNLAAYNASKGAVRLLSKSVALHGARGKPPVRCNSVHPAFLEGPMTDEIIKRAAQPDAAYARMARAIPLNRFGKPAEVAELCVYLLSDESAFVTGAEFTIDGGLTAQ